MAIEKRELLQVGFRTSDGFLWGLFRGIGQILFSSVGEGALVRFCLSLPTAQARVTEILQDKRAFIDFPALAAGISPVVVGLCQKK